MFDDKPIGYTCRNCDLIWLVNAYDADKMVCTCAAPRLYGQIHNANAPTVVCEAVQYWRKSQVHSQRTCDR